MEITQTLAAIAVLVAALTYSVSLVIALTRGREPKVISRMSLRRQLHTHYMDIDWNITEDDTDETVVQKIVDSIDRSGIAFEKVKSDFEAEQEKKRQATPPVYQDPTQAEASRIATGGKKRKKKGK